jgi:putative thioredoxin
VRSTTRRRCWTAWPRAHATTATRPWSSASSWPRNKPPGDPVELAARISANPKDFDARFALAAIHVYEGDFNAAFDQLLEVVLRDKADWREKARVQLVEWFDVCGDAEAVSRGRRYLGMYLN